jgi:hypothetical protein
MVVSCVTLAEKNSNVWPMKRIVIEELSLAQISQLKINKIKI